MPKPKKNSHAANNDGGEGRHLPGDHDLVDVLAREQTSGKPVAKRSPLRRPEIIL